MISVICFIITVRTLYVWHPYVTPDVTALNFSPLLIYIYIYTLYTLYSILYTLFYISYIH
jgi:hypothetical protein